MKISIIDFETTGLDPKWHEIIEIGCVVFDDETLEIQEELDIKVSPIYPQRISAGAQKVNGYTDEKWEKAIGQFDAFQQLATATKGTSFAAYNIIFDWSFLEEAMIHKPFKIDFRRPNIDILSMAYAVLPHKNQRWSLKEVCKKLEIPPEPEIHRAINGARSEYEVYKAICCGNTKKGS